MARIHLAEDIRPLSEFRPNAAGLIQKVRNSGRPLVLTQRGHSAAVLIGVAEYQRLIEELELLRDIQTGIHELDAGRAIPHAAAKKRLRCHEVMRLAKRRS
jgi:prevent-host-death family protein